MKPPVTVVVVTWNARRLVSRCLDGLRRQTYPSDLISVVVVDNASCDGTAAYLAESYPEVTTLRSSRNRGFAGGNNLALRQLTDRYVLLLNNDAVPEPNFVARMVEAMEDPHRRDVAAGTARILLAGSFERAGPAWTRRDDDSGVVLVNSTGNVINHRGYGMDRDWLQPDAGLSPEEDVFGFCGAAAILRRSALEEVGLFDETFFLYYEDTDLSWRLRLAGWRVCYVHGALVRHEHAATTTVGSALFGFHNDRNRLLTLAKNAPANVAWAESLRFPLTTASIRLFENDGLTPARLRALASFVRLLPHALGERRRFNRAARRRVASRWLRRLDGNAVAQGHADTHRPTPRP